MLNRSKEWEDEIADLENQVTELFGMKDRLLKLLKWAENTYRTTQDEHDKCHYGGYIQALKDVLSIMGEDAFTLVTKGRET